MKEPDKRAGWKELAVYALAVVGAFYLYSISGLPAIANAALETAMSWQLDPFVWLGILTVLMFGTIAVVTVWERIRGR